MEQIHALFTCTANELVDLEDKVSMGNSEKDHFDIPRLFVWFIGITIDHFTWN